MIYLIFRDDYMKQRREIALAGADEKNIPPEWPNDDSADFPKTPAMASAILKQLNRGGRLRSAMDRARRKRG